MDSIYMRIVEELAYLNITGKELGKRLNLKKSPLTDWKNGKSKPTLDQLIKMCDIFAVSADYLLFGTHGNPPSSDVSSLISLYQNLSPADQDEIIAIIELKLKRAKD